MKRLMIACLLLGSLLSYFSVQAQPNGKKILLEKITSIGCPGCPWGGYLLDSFLQTDTNVIVVSIHRHDQWHIDSLASPDGDAILDDYMFAHPTLMVDRVKFPDQPRVQLFTNF
ncbi:MAG: hypothetical protein AAF570_23355, partial [Bacteroidota bacterium]